jgi:hypothetical protein
LASASNHPPRTGAHGARKRDADSFGDITPLPGGAIALLTVAVNFVVDWMLFRSSGLKE